MTKEAQDESKRQFGLNYKLSDAKFEEDKRQFGLDYAIKQRETAVKEAEASTKAAGGQSAYQAERTQRILSSVDELSKRVGINTVGPATFAKYVPGTDARDFKADLETLKANISFSELQAMREASKTGGALGQVAIRELELLESTLGSLDQGQSPDNFNKNLGKIRASLDRWNQAITQGSGGTKGTGEGTTFVGPSGTTYKLPY